MKSRSFLVAARSVLALAFLISLGTLDARAKDITVQWDSNPAADNVAGYRVYVGTTPDALTHSVDVGAATTYTFTAADADLMYYFAVAAYNATGEGARSVVTAVGDSLEGVVIKAVHITQLRSAIDAARAARGLSAVAWTDAPLVPAVTPVKAIHLLEMQAAVRDLYTRAGRPLTLVNQPAGWLTIRASHVMELRSAIASLQ